MPKTRNYRTCPACGHTDQPGRGHIIAVLNEFTPVRQVGRCLCPSCHAVWDETYFRRQTEEHADGETVIEIVRQEMEE